MPRNLQSCFNFCGDVSARMACTFFGQGLVSSLVRKINNGSSKQCLDTSSSTISNQLVAGSIIVTHMKSIFVPSLTLKVYGPMRPHIIPPKGWWQQVLLATYHISAFATCLPHNCDTVWHVIGWYVVYPSNVLHFKEALWGVLSLGVVGIGDTMQLIYVVDSWVWLPNKLAYKPPRWQMIPI